MRALADAGQVDSERIVLFAFDDHALPFRHGVRLHLESYRTPVDRTRIVVAPGPPGAPDCKRVIYYGTVLRVGGELWMWYLGQGDDDRWHQRVCLATSRDGYHWEKPHLGLVEYRGSTRNNLVDVLGGEESIVACVVYHDADDPDPARRFKAVVEIKDRPTTFAALFSPDGLRWQEFDAGAGAPRCEPAGGTTFNGCYLLSGHGGSHFGAPRQLVTYLSYDFEHWIEASCLGLRRDAVPPRPYRETFTGGEQVHLGAALWNRGNVIVGLYGQWHGPANNDRRHVAMDLGLVVSSDGLHYTEPVPDFPLVAAAEDGMNHLPAPWNFKHPALVQGQGFENVGGETLFWYAPWPEQLSDGVRAASWPRDRLGYLQPFDRRELQRPNGCHVISAPIDLGGRPAQVAVNAAGLSQHAQMTVEVLDERFRPLAGYSHRDCRPLQAGLRQPVTWRGRAVVDGSGGPIRLRVNYAGVRPEDPQLYAIYLDPAAQP